MINDLIPVIAIICTIGLPIAMAIVLGVQALKGRHAERLSMIEKGIMPDGSNKKEKPANLYSALRNGLVMIGLALGLIVGLLVDPYIPHVSSYGSMSIPAFTIFFGGIGFLVYFFFSRKMKQKEDNNR